MLKTVTVSAVRARQQLGRILDEVSLKGSSIIIEHRGKPKAVLIPVGEYEAMQRWRKQAFDNIEKIGSEARAIWEAEGKTEDEMLDMVNDLVEESRKELAEKALSQLEEAVAKLVKETGLSEDELAKLFTIKQD